LNYDGIRGETVDRHGKEYIEVTSFSFGVKGAAAGAGHGNAGTVHGKQISLPSVDEITIKTGHAGVIMKKDGTITLPGKAVLKGANVSFCSNIPYLDVLEPQGNVLAG